MSCLSDVEDQSGDCLHLDIWDHDDETNVLEAVKKLNEVKGVRGIRRFFKQVAQSAKGADQDDFLGCVTIPIQVRKYFHVCQYYHTAGGSEHWV